MPVPTLITFPPSLDSEFSRFVLNHYGISAREERHVIPSQSFVTLVRARTLRFPVLFGATRGSTRSRSSSTTLSHSPAGATDPGRPGSRRDLRADWKLFHHELNTATTVLPTTACCRDGT